MTPATWGFSTVLERDYDKTALLPTVDLVDSMWKARDKGQNEWGEIFMAMGNGRYRGTWIPLEEAKKKARGNFKKAHPIRFEDRGGSPRYALAERLVHYSSIADFQKKVIDGVWKPGTVFTSGEAFAPGKGVVERFAESANSATIQVRAEARSFLYMSITPHHYWRVWIDGRETASIVANVGFQGVIVPAGRHVVTMRYRNTLVVAMAWLSLSAVLFFVLLAAWPQKPQPEIVTMVDPFFETPVADEQPEPPDANREPAIIL
jgi:hypothetical protein